MNFCRAEGWADLQDIEAERMRHLGWIGHVSMVGSKEAAKKEKLWPIWYDNIKPTGSVGITKDELLKKIYKAHPALRPADTQTKPVKDGG